MTDTDPATAGAPEAVDLMIDGWYVVTMNPTRDIIHRGSVAVRDASARPPTSMLATSLPDGSAAIGS